MWLPTSSSPPPPSQTMLTRKNTQEAFWIQGLYVVKEREGGVGQQFEGKESPKKQKLSHYFNCAALQITGPIPSCLFSHRTAGWQSEFQPRRQTWPTSSSSFVMCLPKNRLWLALPSSFLGILLLVFEEHSHSRLSGNVSSTSAHFLQT